MTNIAKGLIAGTIFGLVSIIPMFFMKFEDKASAIIASFLPDAIVTKQYGPILGLGLIGGIVCGLISK